MRRVETYGKYNRGRGEVFEHFLLAKNIYIQKVSATPVPALKIMPIGPRENIAVIITEWLKSLYSRKKQDWKSRASHHDFMDNWVIEVHLLAETVLQRWQKASGECRAGKEVTPEKLWVQEAGFDALWNPLIFFLQLEVVKESNQTSHIFPKISPLSTVYGMRKRLTKVATSAWTTLCLWIESTKLRWRGIINSCCSSRMFMLLIAKHLHLVVHKLSKHFEDTQGRNELVKLED